MFTNTVSADTLRGIRALGESRVMEKAYLAGGTALALQLGHRISLDLDFFTQEPFEELTVANRLKDLGKFEQDTINWRTVMGTFEGAKFSLFYYEYPLVDEMVEYEGIQMVQPPDISAMKLLAISDRGARRDFVDLYWMRNLFSLEQVFAWYGVKYGRLEERKYHLLRGLQYFEDAEKQDMPVMFKQVDWGEVRQYFEDEVARLSKQWEI